MRLHYMAFALVFALAIIPAMALAHGTEKEEAVTKFFPYSQLDVFYAGTVLLLVGALFSVHYGKRFSKKEKKAVFVFFVVVASVTTGYLVTNTIFVNILSETGGPVHWHADFEVWACGERLELAESAGFSNKVGEEDVHHHNDMRIHVEGVLLHKEDASVGRFFEAIGGHFSADRLEIQLHNGHLLSLRNGDACPEGPGILRFFVNGRLNEEFGDYIIAPYATVPPGDFLNITFGP